MKKYSFVYIIGDTNYKIYKIGKANNVKQRLIQLKCGNPYLKILRIFMYNSEENASSAERITHKRQSSKRFCNEWFKLTNKQLLRVASTLKNRKGYCKKSIREVIEYNTPIKKPIPIHPKETIFEYFSSLNS